MGFHALLWDRLRSTLWFMPAIIIVACSLLALVLIEADALVGRPLLAQFRRLFGAGAEGSRGMLEAIGSAMITVAGVVFSITIVALSLTSSQYSPRVLRNFTRDSSNQAVLGAFVGIYAYCLIVLRTIRSGDGAESFVPSIATLGAIVLALIGIALLIYFIHHIGTSIQAAHILSAIQDETSGAIERMYPEALGTESEEPEHGIMRSLDEREWGEVKSRATGYVQDIKSEQLVKLACEHDAMVRLKCRIGDFVIAEEPLASVSPPHLAPVLAATLVDTVAVGDQRTLTQDASFGIRQLVDIGLKALSPAVNDPTTAIMCLDRLEALMVRVTRARIPSAYRYAEGTLRVVAPVQTFQSLLALTVEEIRLAAREQPLVLKRLASMLIAALERTEGTPRHADLRIQFERVLGSVRTLQDTESRLELLEFIEKCNAKKKPALAMACSDRRT